MTKNENVCCDEYLDMIKALAEKFNADQSTIEAMPEVTKIKDRCEELDEHINFLLLSANNFEGDDNE